VGRSDRLDAVAKKKKNHIPSRNRIRVGNMDHILKISRQQQYKKEAASQRNRGVQFLLPVTTLCELYKFALGPQTFGSFGMRVILKWILEECVKL